MYNAFYNYVKFGFWLCNGCTKRHFIFVPIVDHQSYVLRSSNVGRHFSVYPTDAALLSTWMTHSGSLHRVNPHCPLKKYCTISVRRWCPLTRPKITHLHQRSPITQIQPSCDISWTLGFNGYINTQQKALSQQSQREFIAVHVNEMSCYVSRSHCAGCTYACMTQCEVLVIAVDATASTTHFPQPKSNY